MTKKSLIPMLMLILVLMQLVSCGQRIFDGEREIRAVMNQAEAAWNAGDLEGYMDCYQRSAELRFAAGDQFHFGWHQVLENYRQAYPDRGVMGHLAFTDLAVTPLAADAALVAGRWRLDRPQDQPHGVFTLVMRRLGPGWRIIADHTSSGDGSLTAAEASITQKELLDQVTYLTSDELAGRLPGTAGYRQAAEAVAAHFARLGLQPGGDDGYFQTLPIEANEVIGKPLFRFQGADRPYELGRDYVFRGFTGQGTLCAPVVFCGYGLSLPERGYDDYAGQDVAGKVVLVFKQAPAWTLPDGEGWEGLTDPRPKAQTARDHGALAVLLVSRPNDKHPQSLIGSVLHGAGAMVPDVPQLQISPEVAADLLADSHLDLAQLQSTIDETQAPASAGLQASVDLSVQTRYQPAAKTWNVVGVLPGRDSQLRSETVVLGAHLDHVGCQAGQALFPGANDNASGSAAVLEIAEAFTQGGAQPQRTMVFVLFSGEEQGLIGSTFYCEHPVRPLDATVAMLNFDCVGFGDGIKVGGGKSAPLLWGKARQLDADHDNKMVMATWGNGGADATPFHERGMPTLYFVTTNSYTHLHQTSDRVETLNGPLFQSITRLGFDVAAWVAQGDYPRERLLPQ